MPSMRTIIDIPENMLDELDSISYENSVSSSADESARLVKKSTPQKIDISIATKMILVSISPNKHSSCATKNITFTAQHKRPHEGVCVVL